MIRPNNILNANERIAFSLTANTGTVQQVYGDTGV